MIRKIILFCLISLVAYSGYSQTGSSTSAKSKTKHISFKRNVNTNVVRMLPDLQISNKMFSDENKNNIIDAEENAYIKFKLSNRGKGEAQQVKVKVSLLNGPITGLDYTQQENVGTIYPTQIREILIPIKGKKDLVSDTAKFKIEVLEKNGLDAYPFEMEIQTQKFMKPEIIVADAVFSTESGGKIRLNYPINLKVLVQNIGQGEAKNVKAEFILPNSNCIMLDESDVHVIGVLKPGESKELDFSFTATRRYSFDTIPVSILLTENYGLYAENKTVSVGLEETLAENNAVVIHGINTANKEIKVASLTADVDKNIPVNPLKDPNRIALIIGNEDYSGHQKGLSREADVKYARNDARVFKEYALKTLGVKPDNLYILLDATAGEMEQNIALVSKLASRIGANSEIIFYYAGHGLPDQSTGTPYLVPVDVAGANLSAAIKLSDVYNKLGNSGANKVTVFIDACFSGGGREDGLLAARAVKIKPREETLSGNMVVFSATTGDQTALPYDEKQHGMFTYYLLKKLQDSNGNITYGELADYISHNVSLESLRVNRQEQDPEIKVGANIQSIWKNWEIK